jgi:hypothetical protein
MAGAKNTHLANCETLAVGEARRAFVFAKYMAVGENPGMDTSAFGVHDPLGE